MVDSSMGAYRFARLRKVVWRRGQTVFTASAALALLLVLRAVLPSPFIAFKTYAFDSLQRIAPRVDADEAAPGTGVVVIDIDDASLAHVGQWPWPRSVMADLIRHLQDAGALAIGLDIVFAEPDRTSPATIAPAWSSRLGLSVTPADGHSALPDYDRDLASAIARGRVVTGYGLVAAPNGASPLLAASVAVIGTDPAKSLPEFDGAVANLPMFDEAAAGQGSFTVAEDGHDEVVRSLPLFLGHAAAVVPSLAAEVLRVASGDDDDGTRLRAERAAGPGTAVTGFEAQIGRWTVPVSADGTMRLRYGARALERRLSAERVLDPAEADSVRRIVAGRIVLIGTGAVGLVDLRPTPLSPLTPGVDIHATAIEEILAGEILARPFGIGTLETGTALLFGLAVAVAVAVGGLRAGAVALVAGLAGAGGAALYAFTRHDLLLDPSVAALTGPLAFVVALAVRHFASERRADAMRSAFARYLSPQLVETLARHPDRLQLGGEEREMTFLFTDLEGFTAFTEAVQPAQLVSTLNRYLDGVCAIAMDHGGTIDKIVGDAVHVMFNAPLDQPDHATRAVRCALAIDAFAERFAADAAQRAAVGRAFGTTRIGVNTGRAVVGNFGGNRRFDYTAHGDAINTAARLEAANKRLGTRLCVSRATVEAMTDPEAFRFRPIGALGLKGKANAVDVFAPLRSDAPEASWADRYGDAFARLSRGEEGGAEAILALLHLHPDDPLLQFHAARIDRGQRGTAVPLQAA